MILKFDKYEDLSTKDYERMRHAGESSTRYNLTVNAPFPIRETVMKNTHNKRSLASLDMGSIVTVENGVFSHEEADVTMIAYMLQVPDYSEVIRVMILMYLLSSAILIMNSSDG